MIVLLEVLATLALLLQLNEPPSTVERAERPKPY